MGYFAGEGGRDRWMGMGIGMGLRKGCMRWKKMGFETSGWTMGWMPHCVAFSQGTMWRVCLVARGVM